MNIKGFLKVLGVYLIGYISIMLLWDYLIIGKIVFGYDLLIKAVVSGIMFSFLWSIFTKPRK